MSKRLYLGVLLAATVLGGLLIGVSRLTGGEAGPPRRRRGGLAAYLAILGFACTRGAVARAAAASLSLAACAFSAYLLVVQLTAIGAVCDWCLPSDGVTTLLAGASLLRLRGAVVAPRGQ